MRWRRIAYAAGGGACGLLIILLARGIALLVALSSTGFFSSQSVSIFQILVLYIGVPAMIILAGACTALSLGSSKIRGLVSGIATLLVAVFFYTGPHNYSPFNERETLAFIAAATAAVLFAILGRSGTRRAIAVIAISLALTFVSISSLPVPGIFVASVAWMLIPSVATPFST